jgi:hypothetical protein
VDFCFRRLSKPLAALGAFALVSSFIAVPAAQAHAAGQQPAAGTQPAKNYKDRAEYDLFLKITQTTDPKARLELLNTWQDKYPQSDYSAERLQYFVATLAQLAQGDPTQRQPLINKSEDLLKVDPKNANAMFLISFWGPAVGGPSPSPELLSQVDSAAHAFVAAADEAFSDANRPKNMSAEDFAKAKSIRLAAAHNALAWEASSKKDNATAETEYAASLTSNPDQGNISALLAKLYYEDKKEPQALFEYARAAEYTGPGPALPPATRTQLTDFFNKAYKDFHGSADGAEQILAQAKTSPLPPAGFTIGSAAAAAQKDADAMNARMAADPAFKLWYTIKTNLIGDQGPTFFNNSMKGAEIPGGADGVKDFSGTVITIDPPDRPTKVELGIEDKTKADATLLFSQPLPAAALDKIKVGETLEFDGVADSYNKDPFMVTFKDPTVPGVQTTAPPKTGRRRH